MAAVTRCLRIGYQPRLRSTVLFLPDFPNDPKVNSPSVLRQLPNYFRSALRAIVSVRHRQNWSKKTADHRLGVIRRSENSDKLAHINLRLEHLSSSSLIRNSRLFCKRTAISVPESDSGIGKPAVAFQGRSASFEYESGDLRSRSAQPLERTR